MNKFEKPEIEVIRLSNETIVTASYCNGAPTSMGDVYGSGCNYDPNADDGD